MPLEASQTEPGLWVNGDVPTDGAGVHALIIGTSRYDHLVDGRSPAPETYGLGQLSASALTAYRFFMWLRDVYILDGWPIARVRLVLSPQRKGVGKATSDELDNCDPGVCRHSPEATFANCKSALENWYADMEALRAPATGRSLFIFSGHGMERRQNYQVLLPSDYLRPPGRPVNEAISTPNVSDALSYLPRVSSHVLLLDGCRNDIDKLRGASGAKILNDEQAVAINPLYEKGALYATASGLRAYSPKAGGLSLFGQALLDGLKNQPEPLLDETPIELTRRGAVATIEINRLGSYMKGRVAALIKAANESVIQIVRSEVASSDPGSPIELAQFPPEAPVLLEDRFTLDSTRRPPVPAASQPADWFRERYQAARPARVPPADADRVTQINRFHTMFGAEAVTFPWLDTLRVVGLSTGQSFDHRGVTLLSTAQALRTSPLHRVKIALRVDPNDPIGHVLTIDDQNGRRFCCVLPSDIDKRTFHIEIDAEGRNYINFAAYLASENDGPTGTIAGAWEQLRARDPLSAADGLRANGTEEFLNQTFRDGEETLRQKMRAPLAATVAAVVLPRDVKAQSAVHLGCV
ncbi:caspase family protein [Mesorhizobium yinganensis]|uniref:caspase family protein n=1 Tax=Mesorhizobium yinganensis TaxID=3157707 RepID=UPI0032B7DD4B